MSKKITIEDMQIFAKKKEGKCLSNEYINNRTKLKWQCKKGHTWEAIPTNIMRGKWCPKCVGRGKTIKDMQKIAENQEGKCLTKKYQGMHTKLKWQCKYGHIWMATPNNVKRGTWCPFCVGRRQTIKDMQKLAEKKGGKCLSKVYINGTTKLKWKCKEEHVWWAKPDPTKRGHWCPICSQNISERICRKIFENIFKEKFPKIRPKWLTTSKGNKLELDGFCNKLKIAFEYQGVQHFKSVPMFRETRSLNKQKKVDELKRTKCKENNINLIEIPYFIDYERLPGYIIKKCNKLNIKVPKITKNLDYKTMKIYSPAKPKEMQDLAKKQGGKCLSKRYINAKTKLRWQCKKGHIWEATPDNIKRGKWCPFCYGNITSSIGDMQKLAGKKGGKCLSTKYLGTHVKLKWQCKYGHIWENSPSNIKRGQWCPFCARIVRLTIEEMQDIARERGGKCLSKEYINNKTKLKWQCKEGHVWRAKPDTVKRGQWCPFCAGKRQTIKDMQKIAEERGGKCLSDKYVSAITKLKWQCKQRHVWESIPASVKSGTWCPICGRSKRKT